MMETFKSAFDLEDGNLADFKIIREHLFEIKKLVKERFNQGLPPSEKEAVQGLLKACETAEALAYELFSAEPQ